MGVGKFLSALALLCPTAALAAPPVSPQAAVAAIENGMLPAVEIEGRSIPKTTLAQRMQALHVPGVSIAFVHNGEIDWTINYGVAAPGGVPVTSETRFQATALAMPLTAFAALHEVQAHALNLDGDVNAALTSWHLAQNQYTQTNEVTLRDLLGHTAGVSIRAFPSYSPGSPLPTLDQLLDGKPPAVNAPVVVEQSPGKEWRYSSGGYAVVQKMLEDTSKSPFADFMQKRIFAPLAMGQSDFEQVSGTANRAVPFDASGLPFPRGNLLYPALAAQGLWSTPVDIAKYILEVQSALAGHSKLLSRDLAALMVKPVKSSGLGLGLQIKGNPQHPFFQYAAASQGYVCNFTAYNQGDGIVVMTNGDNGAELIQELLRTVAAVYGWPDFGPSTRKEVKLDHNVLNKYVGYYRLGRYRYVEVKPSDDHLVLQFENESPRELFPVAEQVWFFPDDGEFINFENGPDDRAKSITDHFNGVETTSMRIDEATAKALGHDLKIKLQSNAADPQAEAALHHYIDELEHGTPDYDEMDPTLAQAERQNLPDYHALLNRVGGLKNLSFRGIAHNGADIYDAVFEKGTNEWTILLNANGRIESLALAVRVPVRRSSPEEQTDKISMATQRGCDVADDKCPR